MNRIMNFKKWILEESLKEDEMNRLLDKISSGNTLSTNEIDFLNKYDKIDNDEIKDYFYLSPDVTSQRIRNLLNSNKTIICDLEDRYGKLGLEIKSIYYENESHFLNLEGNKKYQLKDNHLYNIKYDIKNNKYILLSHDEYFEKIPINNEN